MAYNPYIPWNDEMVVVLLNLVVTEGVHIAKKSEITKKWNAVNDLFFEQNELLLYKSAYKKDKSACCPLSSSSSSSVSASLSFN